MQIRLKKLQKTTDYVKTRVEGQEGCKRKFEFVLQMVKKKLLSHNRRIENLIFSGRVELRTLSEMARSDTALSVGSQTTRSRRSLNAPHASSPSAKVTNAVRHATNACTYQESSALGAFSFAGLAGFGTVCNVAVPVTFWRSHRLLRLNND